MSNTVTVTVTVQKTLIDRLSSFTQQSTKVLFSDHRSLARARVTCGSRLVHASFMPSPAVHSAVQSFRLRSVLWFACRGSWTWQTSRCFCRWCLFVSQETRKLQAHVSIQSVCARSRYHRSLSRCQPDAIRTKKKMSKSRSLSSESLIFAS